MFNLICSECGSKHEIQTGSAIGRWLEQCVCPRCEVIVSRWPQAPGEEPERCPTCAGELEFWAGKVWFEPRPGEPYADSVEHYEGPCPSCGTKLTKADMDGGCSTSGANSLPELSR
jgi:hypothetical protein